MAYLNFDTIFEFLGWFTIRYTNFINGLRKTNTNSGMNVAKIGCYKQVSCKAKREQNIAGNKINENNQINNNEKQQMHRTTISGQVKQQGQNKVSDTLIRW